MFYYYYFIYLLFFFGSLNISVAIDRNSMTNSDQCIIQIKKKKQTHMTL